MRSQLDDLCCSFDWDRVCMTVNPALAWQHSDIKIVNIFLPISFNICFWCPKQPSHWGASFEYPQNMFLLRNKKNSFYTLLTKGLTMVMS